MNDELRCRVFRALRVRGVKPPVCRAFRQPSSRTGYSALTPLPRLREWGARRRLGKGVGASVRTVSRRLHRRAFYRPALVLSVFLLIICATAARAQQETLPGPTDQAGWVTRLSKITEFQNSDWNALYTFRNYDPDFTYATIKALWSGKISVSLKNNLMQNFASDYGEFTIGTDGLPISNPKINPHLLDILDLGATDANEDARRTALNLSYNVAVHAFDTPDEYKAWRKATAARPIADLARENYRALFERFIHAAPDAKMKMLGQITRLSFSSGTYGTSVNGKEVHGILAHGLTGIRRQMAIEMGLLDAVASLLRTPKNAPAPTVEASKENVRQALWFFMSFTPDAPFMQKIEPEVQAVIEAQQNVKVTAAYETIWFLQELQQKRVGDQCPAGKSWKSGIPAIIRGC